MLKKKASSVKELSLEKFFDLDAKKIEFAIITAINDALLDMKYLLESTTNGKNIIHRLYQKRFLVNLQDKKYTKSRIFNLDLFDYIKLGLFTYPIKLSIIDEKYQQDFVTYLNKEQFLEILNSNKYLLKHFQYLLRQINNQIIAFKFGKYSDTKNLKNEDDKIGDTIQLKQDSIVDLGNRSAVAVYINDEWIKNDNSNAIHADIVRNYLNKITNSSFEDLEDAKINDADTLNYLLDYTTDEKKDVAQKHLQEIDNKPLVFANIQDKIGYILSVKNISKKEAADKMKQHFNLDKVYFQQSDLYKYTRLAKKIL